jgi:hypothetical protein
MSMAIVVHLDFIFTPYSIRAVYVNIASILTEYLLEFDQNLTRKQLLSDSLGGLLADHFQAVDLE